MTEVTRTEIDDLRNDIQVLKEALLVSLIAHQPNSGYSNRDVVKVLERLRSIPPKSPEGPAT